MYIFEIYSWAFSFLLYVSLSSHLPFLLSFYHRSKNTLLFLLSFCLISLFFFPHDLLYKFAYQFFSLQLFQICFIFSLWSLLLFLFLWKHPSTSSFILFGQLHYTDRTVPVHKRFTSGVARAVFDVSGGGRGWRVADVLSAASTRHERCGIPASASFSRPRTRRAALPTPRLVLSLRQLPAETPFPFPNGPVSRSARARSGFLLLSESGSLHDLFVLVTKRQWRQFLRVGVRPSGDYFFLR